MKHTQLYILIITVISALGYSSCIEDGFTTDPNKVLTFSTDTLRFDTIFTETGTATLKIKVFNHNNKSLNIESISMENGSDTPFNINVDGMSGSTFSNVEVRANDSIFIFVEANPNASGSNLPLLIEDKLRFVTNGKTQNVVMRAWGQDVIRLRGEEITENTTLRNDIPYIIFDSLVVKKDATLNLQPGTTLYFHSGAYLHIYGKLNAEGSKDMPVTLRADRLDKVTPKVSFDIMPGQWQGVIIDKDSYGNSMKYVHLRNAMTCINIDSCSADIKKLDIDYSIIRNCKENVICSNNAWIECKNSELSDASLAVVQLNGGKAYFTHCTLANTYIFDIIYNPIITLTQLFPDDISDGYTQLDAHFHNCLIYGSIGDIMPGDLNNTNVKLEYCLLRASGTDDDNFIKCVWNADPMWKADVENYIFDYRLGNSKSDAAQAGSASFVTSETAYDMYGNYRLNNDNPDIGAYVYVADPK